MSASAKTFDTADSTTANAIVAAAASTTTTKKIIIITYIEREEVNCLFTLYFEELIIVNVAGCQVYEDADAVHIFVSFPFCTMLATNS